MRTDTLSDAMRAVLLDQQDNTAPSCMIAEEILRRQLWFRKSDTQPVEAFQIELRARTRSGRGWFEESGGIVKLTHSGLQGTLPKRAKS